MPKENKKFINPLLRPTQDVEVRQETPTSEGERPAPAKKTASVQSSTETSTYPLVDEQDISSPLEELEVSSYTQEQPSTYASAKTQYVQEVPPAKSREPARTPRQTVTEASTYTPVPEAPTMGGAVRSPRAQELEYPSTYPAKRTYTPAETYTVRSSQQPARPLQEAPYPTQREEENPYYVEQPPVVRRRRGSQAFERTHERITLWIDRRLKQAFDELAYQQELSKTALLNEAVADLLRKYDTREG